MRATLQQLLLLTRQVFTGDINRTELSRRAPHEQVFVATAIMLAARQDFLDENNKVQGFYSEILHALLSAGIVNLFAREKGYRHGSTLLGAARSSGLYRPNPGRGGVKPIILTPPAELTALVEELGYTPAVARFLQDAKAGVEQHKRWNEEYVNAITETAAQQRRHDYMEQVLRETKEQFGLEGLRDLKARIEQRLQN